jgi:hypothetical protein
MKRYLLFLTTIFITLPFFIFAQSKTTEALQKKHSDATALFFYQNTLRMLNQTEDKAFDDLIKDIEKMKLLMIRKNAETFDVSAYKKLVAEYKSESYEEMMTSRFDGKNFDVFMKEGKGMLVLVNDEENLFVLDIIGSIALNQVTKLYSTLDESTDIGKKIKDFTRGGEDRKRKSEDEDEDNDEDAGNGNEKGKKNN